MTAELVVSEALGTNCSGFWPETRLSLARRGAKTRTLSSITSQTVQIEGYEHSTPQTWSAYNFHINHLSTLHKYCYPFQVVNSLIKYLLFHTIHGDLVCPKRGWLTEF